MICHRHKCIFVEVPKTGTSSVRSLLGFPPKPHLDIWQIRHDMRHYWTRYDGWANRFLASAYLFLPEWRRAVIGEQRFKAYFKFGFVRNPWDRVVSLYLRREGLQMRDRMSFAEFVDWIRYSSSTCTHPVPHTNQLDWFVDPHGNLLVDFIGRFEDLKNDWKIVARQVGLTEELPTKNRNTAKRHYTEYYSEKTKAIIEKKFRVDIDYFGYEFGH